MDDPKPVRDKTEWASKRICLMKWLRVIWVCRASVFSVLFGAALSQLSQVHDLFLDGSGPPILDYIFVLLPGWFAFAAYGL
jgi:hypothetical protein